VVFVALNRGYRYRKKQTSENDGRGEPQFYVFPVDVIRTAQSPNSSWGKVFLRNIDNHSQYINHWELIRAFMAVDALPILDIDADK